MAKALDDILLGFLLFFIVDRTTRLFSNSIVEPWAQNKTSNKNVVENWKLGAELVFLISAAIFVAKSRGLINKLNRA